MSLTRRSRAWPGWERWRRGFERGGPFATRRASAVLHQSCVGRIVAYQLDLGLTALLNIEDERLLKTSFGFVQSQEGLVRSLCCLVLGSGHDQLQRIGRAKLDLFVQARDRRESVG